MIYKKSPHEIEIMRRAGAIVADTLSVLGEAVKPGISTAKLDRIAEEAITAAGGRPSFKGYRGFPASICASPNEVIVHGIPGDDVVLGEGDIVSLDVGVYYEGFHGDSAWTFPVGEVDEESRRLLEVTEKALYAAIERCAPGERLGTVGAAVEEIAAESGFSIATGYGGHGVGRSLHEDPWVPNHGPAGRRERLDVGMTLALEPMFNAGTGDNEVLSDEWTVVTWDGQRSAHFEHTVAIVDGGVEVLTAARARRGAA